MTKNAEALSNDAMFYVGFQSLVANILEPGRERFGPGDAIYMCIFASQTKIYQSLQTSM